MVATHNVDLPLQLDVLLVQLFVSKLVRPRHRGSRVGPAKVSLLLAHRRSVDVQDLRNEHQSKADVGTEKD